MGMVPMRATDSGKFHLSDRVDLILVDPMQGEDLHMIPSFGSEPADTPELQMWVVGEEIGQGSVDTVSSCADSGNHRC